MHGSSVARDRPRARRLRGLPRNAGSRRLVPRNGNLPFRASDRALPNRAQARVAAAQLHQFRADAAAFGRDGGRVPIALAAADVAPVAVAPRAGAFAVPCAKDGAVVVAVRAVGQVVVAVVPRPDEVAVRPAAVVVVDVVARRVVEPVDVVGPRIEVAVDRSRARCNDFHHARLRFQHRNERVHGDGAGQIEQPGTAQIVLRRWKAHLEPVLFAALGNGEQAGAPLQHQQFGVAAFAAGAAGDQHHFVQREIVRAEAGAFAQELVDLDDAALGAVGEAEFAERDFHADAVVVGFVRHDGIPVANLLAGAGGERCGDGSYGETFHGAPRLAAQW